MERGGRGRRDGGRGRRDGEGREGDEWKGRGGLIEREGVLGPHVFVVVHRVVLVAYPHGRVLVIALSSCAPVVVPSFPVLVVMWLSWCQVSASSEGGAWEGGCSPWCSIVVPRLATWHPVSVSGRCGRTKVQH